MVKSRDGKTNIPVNLVYRKDIMDKYVATGELVHTHLYGYGSYEACMEASFSATRLTLLNRGIVYAIAQVRGGGEMGRKWLLSLSMHLLTKDSVVFSLYTNVMPLTFFNDLNRSMV